MPPRPAERRRRAAGSTPRPFVEILTNTMVGGRARRIYGDKIVAQRYAPGLALPVALKNVRLALAEAESAAVPMPSVSVVTIAIQPRHRP